MAVRRDLWLNGVLALQVAISLLLTGWLWLAPLGQTVVLAGKAEITQPPSPGAQAPLDVLRPERLLMHLGPDDFAAARPGSPAYAAGWQLLKPLLANASVVRPGAWEVVSDRELAGTLPRLIGVEVQLALPLSMSDWAREWEGTAGPDPHASLLIDRIFIGLGNDAATYYFGPGSAYRGPAQGASQQAILLNWLHGVDRKQVEPYRLLKPPDGTDVAPGLLLPKTAAVVRAQVRPAPVPARPLKEGLFPDLSVVREIAEGEGALVYTDGQKYLRINPKGSIEFSAPELAARSRPPELARAMRLAVEFVSNHGGWPQGLMLTGVSQERGHTRLDFGRFEGSLMLVSRDPLVRVDLSDDRVIYYARSTLYQEVDAAPVEKQAQVSAMTPEQVLASLPNRRFPSQLRRIFLAYRLQDDQPVPVWCFGFGDQSLLMVDAYTGKVLP